MKPDIDLKDFESVAENLTHDFGISPVPSEEVNFSPEMFDVEIKHSQAWYISGKVRSSRRMLR